MDYDKEAAVRVRIAFYEKLKELGLSLDKIKKLGEREAFFFILQEYDFFKENNKTKTKVVI